MRFSSRPLLIAILLISTIANHARSAEQNYSPAVSGTIGLNTVPSARMDESGTISAGISTLDPYAHSFLGFQIAEPLYVGIRQTAEISDIFDDANRLYPGLDFKLRLLKESAYAPEIAIGAASAIGHRRSAGEYIALSKRYHDLDFTAGLGWGRFGSAGHFDNPLKALHSHFGKARPLDGEMPNEPADWFTGEKIGLFGGIEYFTPIDSLSFKFDIGADRYIAESKAFGFNAPAPWSLGLNYQPYEWMNAGLALQGGNKLMGRLTFKGRPASWPFTSSSAKSSEPLKPYRPQTTSITDMRLSSEKDGLILRDIQASKHSAIARLELSPYRTGPSQFGQAIHHMANHAGENLEEFILEPRIYGLRGPKIKLMRRDFENALARNQGSAEEIWANAEFITDQNTRPELAKSPLMKAHFKPKSIRFILDNQIGLSEEDSGTLYRTSFITAFKGPTLFNMLHTGTSWRWNIKHNLDKIGELRPRKLLPVRSNVDQFADNGIALDRLYTALTHSFTPELHMMGAAGYLEEMYAGAGGEILYRPFGKRFGISLETWLAFKRDPFQPLAEGLNGDSLLTGHIKGWYELPGSNLTLHAKAGRYLAEDLGATLSLSKTFKNGSKLESYVTISDTADFDLFGGTTHADHGIRLTLPLGSLPHVPDGSEIRIKTAPFGRDIGQSLDAPMKLYELTEHFSYRHITENWGDITQ